ncbi:MAG: hypothetical protein OES38_05155 [Gammaproteobacteria bacterium]|nr:hypothetical protein [Gammaproteobacteria bacterium]
MIGPILVLTLAFAATAALLLNLNLATRYSRVVKGAAIIVVSVLYAGSWYGYQGLLGWASPDPLPETFRVLWITMDEPDKATDGPGAIYFWVRELDEAGLPVGVPRAHRIAWNEESAEAAQEALERMEDGELLNGRMSRNMVAEDQTRAEDGADYAGDPSISGDGGLLPEFEFTRVPPPSLPAKQLL